MASLVLAQWTLAAPPPVGRWDFDNPANPLQSTVGQPLTLVGEHQTIAGIWDGDGAVRIPVGSYYRCTHGIAPNGGGNQVNVYSLLIDFRPGALGPWYCFFQTNPENQTDGDCFIRAGDGAIGVGMTGYSTARVTPDAWQRLLVTVDNAHGIFRIYLEGDLILEGSGQPVDGRFGLLSSLLLFADEDGEDATLDVTRVAIYDRCLTAADAAELAGVKSDAPGNRPPLVSPDLVGPRETVTGQNETYRLSATDPEAEGVRLRIDWGDGSLPSAWTSLQPTGAYAFVTHAFRQAGTFTVRALAQDATGHTGSWVELAQIKVSGTTLANVLTPPYLQNVTANGITIMWELDATLDATVEYGPDTNYGATSAATSENSAGGTRIYRCRLTGLQPGTSYAYRTRFEGRLGPGGSFRTAPAGAADFAFSVWSDSQGSNHGAYPGDPLEPTKAMFRHMATNGLDLAVTVGDLAENGNLYADTRQYYLDRVAALLGIKVPWFVAWGNHDGGPDSVIRQFSDLPSQNRPGHSPGAGSFSFNYADCHFVCLDLDGVADDLGGWLEQDLQSDANRSALFSFVFIHVPPFCEVWIDGADYLRESLVPLMEQYGVDICFSGHTHEYERGELNGVFYCITGGGSWLDIPELVVMDWPHMTVGGAQSIPGVPRADLDHGGGLINEYVRVAIQGNHLTASMIGFAPDGTPLGIFDTFEKTATTPPPPAEVLFVEDFENTPELGLPPGWTATHHTTVDVNGNDPENPRSNTYLTWTVIGADRLTGVFGPNRIANPAVVHGHTMYAESDHRQGVQLQYLTSPDLQINGATNVELSFLSNYMQNQDSLGAVEYSVDHGQTWLPALYLLEASDIVRAADESIVDGTATFTRVDVDAVPVADGSKASGGTYGEHILSRPFSALGPFVAGRVNDDELSSRRLERHRLPGADKQATVRLRFTLIGSASWFWGIDEVKLLGVRTTQTTLVLGASITTQGLVLTWSGADGPYQLQSRTSLEAPWIDDGPVLDAAMRTVTRSASGPARFFRMRLAR